MLEKVHQECPELSIPDQNKVYNMEQILANIHEYDNASADRECSSVVDNAEDTAQLRPTLLHGAAAQSDTSNQAASTDVQPYDSDLFKCYIH